MARQPYRAGASKGAFYAIARQLANTRPATGSVSNRAV